MWLYLESETELFSGQAGSVLHFAPESAVARRLADQPRLDYVTADLDPRRGTEVIDVTAIPRADSTFDIVLMSHVLEHIADDRKAMSELFRVLKPGGKAILQHPVDYARPITYEDWALTTSAERKVAFLQEDHVRIYGADLPTRLRSVGFNVQVRRFREELPPESRRYYCLDQGTELQRSDDIYECEKRA
jgi:SAM-dependent methyltransferase